jgi:hypothetical protein
VWERREPIRRQGAAAAVKFRGRPEHVLTFAIGFIVSGLVATALLTFRDWLSRDTACGALTISPFFR